ncbi:glycyl-radical enzyme activating protein [Clostridium sp. YIM B02551]|uniref:glycyl-radical enzyme activating protein n=1 Tax=Clostridium sp. YIM B02551 TaxID=2910679 RepID=UPI001EE9B786|nr:glycyl-radical enzyme activating protein [Clostridium sp. YIM B02551]
MEALICDIEHYAIHDGPGIRTVVFLKGCPLRCLWCSNPETQSGKNQLYYSDVDCISCGRCILSCEDEALSLVDGKLKIDHKKCTTCGECIKSCPTSSLKFVAENMTAQEVFEEVYKDEIFYRQSLGGVTVSGGEVLMNADFVIELLTMCKENYISTAVETSGYGEIEKLKDLSKVTDTFLFDIKHTNSQSHKELTGVPNEVILNNLKELSRLNKQIIIRIPLIPGLNDDKENISKTIKIAKENNINEIHILPYHTLGMDKYKRLQKEYKLKDLDKRDLGYIETLKAMVEEENIKCIIGG